VGAGVAVACAEGEGPGRRDSIAEGEAMQDVSVATAVMSKATAVVLRRDTLLIGPVLRVSKQRDLGPVDHRRVIG
jgi:hypothetical protein